MKVEQIGDATLYCAASAQEVMAAHQWSIGAVFTDPPFGISILSTPLTSTRLTDTRNGYGNASKRPSVACAPGSPGDGVAIRNAPSSDCQSGSRANGGFLVAAKNFVQMRPTAMQWAFDPVVCWWTPGAKPYVAGTASRDWFIANTAPVVSRPENIEKDTHARDHSTQWRIWSSNGPRRGRAF